MDILENLTIDGVTHKELLSFGGEQSQLEFGLWNNPFKSKPKIRTMQDMISKPRFDRLKESIDKLKYAIKDWFEAWQTRAIAGRRMYVGKTTFYWFYGLSKI